MGRQPCCDKLGVKKGPWAAEEDTKLIQFILTHGQCCWRAVPKLAGLRWTNYLRPDLKRGLLNEDEEQMGGPTLPQDLPKSCAPRTVENSSTDESWRTSSESGGDDDPLMNLLWSESFTDESLWNVPCSDCSQLGLSKSEETSLTSSLDYQNDHSSFGFGEFGEIDINSLDMVTSFISMHIRESLI